MGNGSSVIAHALHVLESPTPLLDDSPKVPIEVALVDPE